MKFLLALLLFIPLPASKDISMAGIKINTPRTALYKVPFKLVADEKGVRKYKTDNGNDFSITIENDKVVYMENDWLQRRDGQKPLFTDFEFGKTTLKEIRERFGTNGFAYASNDLITNEKELIQFDCYEYESPGKEVLVVITKLQLSPTVNAENIAERSKLDAIIIARKDYLDKIWGAEKLFSKNYRKIQP